MYTDNLLGSMSQENSAVQPDRSPSLLAQLGGPDTSALRGNIQSDIISAFQTSVGTQRKFPSTYTGEQFEEESLTSSVWRGGAGGMISYHVNSCYPAAHSLPEQRSPFLFGDNRQEAKDFARLIVTSPWRYS